jgi:hypothetical protein
LSKTVLSPLIIAAMEKAGFAQVTWRSPAELTDDTTAESRYLVRGVRQRLEAKSPLQMN